ncbi:Glycoside hydrolase/deacetylase, partial [Pleurostoma richardsiae]
MWWHRVSALLGACLGIVAAHGDHDAAIPKIMGGREFLSEIRAKRQDLNRAALRKPAKPVQLVRPSRRQIGGDDGECGPGLGSCAAGYCCSAEGWCGIGPDYCTSPDCQINYGPACDGNKVPSGVSTARIARPKLGSVPYGGAGIYDCAVAGDIALTFDDGPYSYTGDLLDKLKAYGAKATFFITGNNLGKGMINDPSKPWAGYIKRMIAEGHQVASHTWSHQNASQLTNAQFQNQMLYNEVAFNDILGFFPAYMRPPFSICERACETILASLGYHVVYFDLDTEGYLNDDPELIQTSKDIWDDAVDGSDPAVDSFLQIEHDIHYQTVYNLTDYVLSSLFAHGYRSVTVGECLGDPPAYWYRAGSGSLPGGASPTSAAPSKTS